MVTVTLPPAPRLIEEAATREWRMVGSIASLEMEMFRATVKRLAASHVPSCAAAGVSHPGKASRSSTASPPNPSEEKVPHCPTREIGLRRHCQLASVAATTAPATCSSAMTSGARGHCFPGPIAHEKVK